MLRELYRFFIGCENRRRWEKEAQNIIQLVGLPSTAKEFNIDGKILVIAPHADDELIGCHQLMINHKDKVTVFYCGFLGSNPSEENRLTRETEFLNYVNHIGVQYITSTPKGMREDLECTIQRVSPEVVCLPSYVDWHPEHRRINDVLLEVLPSCTSDAKICWYHVSLPIPMEYVNCFSCMNKKQHLIKWELMSQFYRSQLHMDLQRFRYIESLHGGNNKYAETYLKLSISDWVNASNRLFGENKNMNQLKDSLGCIKQMYLLSDNYYKKIFCKEVSI